MGLTGSLDMGEIIMATATRTIAVGAFEDRQRAQQAVDELRRLGFREDQIGVAARGDEHVEGATAVGEKGSKVATGAGIGAATGLGVGALWGIGILAGVMPVIGPAIAGGTLATILSSAVAGAAAAGLAGALIGLGIPEEEAEFFDQEFKEGRTIVTVKADGRYDQAMAVLRRFGAYDMHGAEATARFTSASTSGQAAISSATAGRTGTRSPESTASQRVSAEGERTFQVVEEEVRLNKQPVEAGEVHVRKEVHTEHRTIDVPVRKEEVVIERHPVSGRTASAADMKPEEIRVPVREDT